MPAELVQHVVEGARRIGHDGNDPNHAGDIAPLLRKNGSAERLAEQMQANLGPVRVQLIDDVCREAPEARPSQRRDRCGPGQAVEHPELANDLVSAELHRW